jgi:hypothetical protein
MTIQAESLEEALMGDMEGEGVAITEKAIEVDAIADEKA